MMYQPECFIRGTGFPHKMPTGITQSGSACGNGAGRNSGSVPGEALTFNSVTHRSSLTGVSRGQGGRMVTSQWSSLVS